jgi:hypothetical protein
MTPSVQHIQAKIWQVSYSEWPEEGDTLAPLLFSFAVEYAIKRIQKNQEELKLNRTNQFFACVEVNIVGKKHKTP